MRGNLTGVSKHHRDCRPLEDRRCRLLSQVKNDTAGPRELPKFRLFLGSSLIEWRDAVDSERGGEVVYQPCAEYEEGVYDKIHRSFRKQEPSRFKRVKERLHRSLSKDSSAALVLFGALFHRLPTAGPEIRLSRIDSGSSPEKGDEIHSFPQIFCGQVFQHDRQSTLNFFSNSHHKLKYTIFRSSKQSGNDQVGHAEEGGGGCAWLS